MYLFSFHNLHTIGPFRRFQKFQCTSINTGLRNRCVGKVFLDDAIKLAHVLFNI